MMRTALIGISLAAAVAGLAALEPADGKIMIGAWYDRPNGATPKAINQRLSSVAGNGLAFFQTDIDLTGVVVPLTGPNITDQFLQHLDDTNSDASGFITLYPFNGFDAVTDAQLSDITARILKIVKAGRKVFIRYAPEMNGSWFLYGQDPAGFIKSYKRVVEYIRKAAGTELASSIAFIWSPNSGNGYPFNKGLTSPIADGIEGSVNSTRIEALDTNGSKNLDNDDDPYLPYYPGDPWVDWVGISIYHYGIKSPWIDNVVPEPNRFEGFLQGNVKPDWGHKPFYTYFADGGNEDSKPISAGNKPVFIAETGATYHYGWSEKGLKDGYKVDSPPPSPQNATMVQIKRAWWQQSYLSADFHSKFPAIKAVCMFEFVKDEEETKRDFTVFGTAPFQLPGDGAVTDAWISDAKSASFLSFAGPAPLQATTAAPASITASGSVNTGTVSAPAIASSAAAASTTATTARGDAVSAFGAKASLVSAVFMMIVVLFA